MENFIEIQYLWKTSNLGFDKAEYRHQNFEYALFHVFKIRNINLHN